MTNLNTAEAAVLEQAEARKEPQWLMDLRKKGFQNIEKLPLPTPDKTKITQWNFAVQADTVSAEIEIPSEVKDIWEGESSNVLVLYKNQIVYQNTTEAFKQSGVVFASLFDAARSHEELVKENLMTKVIQPDAHRLTALHAALLNSGILVYAPKNAVLDEPIHVVFLQKGAEPFHNHVLLVADANSQISYVETTFSVDSAEVPATATVCSELIVNDGAKVNYAAIDALGENVTAYVSRQAQVHRNAELDVAHGALGENNAVFETLTYLYGEASVANTRTIAVGTKKQKQNFTVKTTHYGKHSEGFILNHGVGMDASVTIFNGIGKIEFGACRANAQQSSRLLMLNREARGDANPILLIDEHDVMAGHAASVGKIDENQMYYLMSRGLPKEEAERLIIHGFLAPVVAEVPIEKVRNLLVRMIEGKVSR